MKIKISIAMMVKDEEANLPRCLDSIKELLSMGVQLVVVDTGSSDKSMEICREYGAELYEHPWERNFAKHRNQSFSYAKGDWILQLDADETIDFRSRHPSLLFQQLEKMPKKFVAGAFALIDWRNGEPHAETHAVRIFRRGQVRYERRAHNEPKYKNEAVIIPGIYLNHYGYDLTEDQMKIKAARTISILEEMIQEDPADYESIFYVAQAYGSWLKDYEKCLKYAEMYYEAKEEIQKVDPVKFNTSVFYLMASIHFNKGRWKECHEWIKIALKEIPGDLDICHLLLRLGLAINQPMLASLGSRGFVNAYDAYEQNRAKKGARFTFHYNTASLAFALYHLAMTYFEQGKINVDRMFDILDRPEIVKEFKDDLGQGFAKFCEMMRLKYGRGPVLVDPNKVSPPAKIIVPQHQLDPKAIKPIIRASS
jgi:glycosyltransferase involved in cell wall biosynthesis